MADLEAYYNKFNEDKRLKRPHGLVEFNTSMYYIHEVLKEYEHPQILDVGAGTGAYCVPLANEGYDVSAIELVKSNLGTLKAKKSSVKAYQGNALDLSRFKDDSFDVTLIFGPMYHLHKEEEKVQVLREASRVTRNNGTILVAYCMNDYCIVTHAFKDHHYEECVATGMLDDEFVVKMPESELYDYVTLEQIAHYNELAQMERQQIIGVDGPADFMRPMLKDMSDEEFDGFLKYVLKISTRADLLGANAHTLDILKNRK